MLKFIRRKRKVWQYKRLLRKMVRAMEKADWDADDIMNVLLYIGGEVSAKTASVQERLREDSNGD